MSERVCVDTNVFIRLFTQDDLRQTEAAAALFRLAENGQFAIVINDLIVSEIAWVLRRTYKQPPNEIRRRMLAMIRMPFVKVRPADLTDQIANAFDLFVLKNIDFTDAYIASWMMAHDLRVVYTFNRKHFARVAGLEVRIPVLAN
jgi:predicted nucleic acid-binding protein